MKQATQREPAVRTPPHPYEEPLVALFSSAERERLMNGASPASAPDRAPDTRKASREREPGRADFSRNHRPDLGHRPL